MIARLIHPLAGGSQPLAGGGRGKSFIELPAAPRTGSHVPGLTSIHSARRRGPYGSHRYRGNCGGYLIRDLVRYYKPDRVLDPMTGSGTCRDVCQELGVECHSFDLRLGQDAGNEASYAKLPECDFVWLHPPYWRMIRYNDDHRCLSNAASLETFLEQMQAVLDNARSVLSRRGKIAVLIGGYSDNGCYQPLPHLIVERALRSGLQMAAIEIIRLQYGNTSSRRSYRSSFIPGLHDQCLIFEPTPRLGGTP